MGRRGFGPRVPREAIIEYVHEEQKAGRIASTVSGSGIAGALLGGVLQRAFASHFLGIARPVDEDKRFVRELVETILEPSIAPSTRGKTPSRQK
jgi:hypothetical protein